MDKRDIFDFPVRKFNQAELDPLFEDTTRLVIEHQNASASFIQRKLSIGYARAARVLDELHLAGIIGPADGAAPRKLFFDRYDDFLSFIGNASGSDKQDAEDFSWYKLPPVNSSDLGFVPKVWEIPFGMDEKGISIALSLEQLGHLLIVGNPLSRKMVFIDAVICSQLVSANPEQVRFLFIDQSGYLRIYDGIPHLLSPTIIEADRNISALQWLMAETKRRQEMFSQAGVRSFESYRQLKDTGKLPRIIVVHRWLEEADKTLESIYAKLIGFAHTAGIHMIFISDYAGSRFLPVQLKANLPHLMVFKTTSAADSRTAGISGAEELNLDETLLKSFDSKEPVKLKASEISEGKVKQILKAIPRP